MTVDFESFRKISRLNRDCVITEKIDGTNAQIVIGDEAVNPTFQIGSRNRWLTGPGKDDNQGFWSWAQANKDALLALGPGRHYGEWWGCGIQRGYGLTEKRFSLFNTAIWRQETAPACCGVVPVLYQGAFDTARIAATLTLLGARGSTAAPGFLKPEGIVVYHTHASQLFKVTLEKDDAHKGTL